MSPGVAHNKLNLNPSRRHQQAAIVVAIVKAMMATMATTMMTTMPTWKSNLKQHKK
jgi:hypothetical protein